MAIIANAIVLGISSDENGEDFEKILELVNLGFFGFFVFELLSKLIGQGIKHYLRDHFNWFDGLVVLVSSIDITFQYTFNSKYRPLTLIREPGNFEHRHDHRPQSL